MTVMMMMMMMVMMMMVVMMVIWMTCPVVSVLFMYTRTFWLVFRAVLHNLATAFYCGCVCYGRSCMLGPAIVSIVLE